jgi:hypothetical protein
VCRMRWSSWWTCLHRLPSWLGCRCRRYVPQIDQPRQHVWKAPASHRTCSTTATRQVAAAAVVMAARLWAQGRGWGEAHAASELCSANTHALQPTRADPPMETPTFRRWSILRLWGMPRMQPIAAGTRLHVHLLCLFQLCCTGGVCLVCTRPGHHLIADHRPRCTHARTHARTPDRTHTYLVDHHAPLTGVRPGVRQILDEDRSGRTDEDR